MKIAASQIDITCPEADIYNRLLSLDHKHLVELGCGAARITRDIAESGFGRKISAFEVDEIAHQKNRQIDDLQNVTFGLAGAQDIPLQDESVDVVFMFKSLHHVPVELMSASMQEIRRILKPGGFAYISEPVFAGKFNDILRLFHDEQTVREAAFGTLTRAVDEGLFKLVEEIFFYAPLKFENFAEFDSNVIKATHGNHQLDGDLYNRVKQHFDEQMGDDGVHFLQPIRVDLLQK